MQEEDVPTKTDQGQQEISQRSRKLSPRQRMLLISINGTARVADLRKQFGAIGDFDELMRQLATLDLINLPVAAPPRAPAAKPAASAPAAPAPRVSAPPAPAPAASIAPDAEALGGTAGAKQLMNETAFATLGLRAYMFTLKLEHCYSADELRALLPDFEHLLSKAKGEEFASALIARVHGMLADDD